MNTILNDLSNVQAIIKANEGNMISFWANYGRLPGGEVQEDGSHIRVTTSVPFPLFNGVYAAQLTTNGIEPTIQSVITHFRSHRLPMFWWVGPSTRPSDLGRHLEAQGFHKGGTVPGMAILLADLPERTPTPTDFHIQPVDDLQLIRAWVKVLTVSNNIPDAVRPALIDLEIQRGIDGPLSPRRYLGYWRGEPVAASACHMDAGVAGLYAVGTLPEARGNGIGAAMSLKPLLDARDNDYKVGILQASGMGEPVYRRLGFKTYCEYRIFYLP